jgi:glucosamine-6-phosphate deaminase
MRIVIKSETDAVAQYTAEYIVRRITNFAPTATRPFVLGLPTGGTPIKTYQRLIQAFREGRVSFKHVITFNMDEYVGLPRDHPESYYSFMWANLFKYIDISKENANILDGNAPDLIMECQGYEDKIAAVGGIELFLAGIGPDGHIAFNEPGSSLASTTRVKSLNSETVAANARFFGGEISKVPTMALTVGVKTVLNAREVVVIITGENKAHALAQCVEGGINHMWTVSALQMHPRVVMVVDEAATAELKVRTVQYFRTLAGREDELDKRQKNALTRIGNVAVAASKL